MTITILNVQSDYNPPKNGKGAGWYKRVVDFSDENGRQGKQTIFSFKNPAVDKVVQNMQPGENYEVTVAKDGQYDVWAAVTRSAPGNAVASPSPATKPLGSTPGKVLGNNYETATERAVKQRLIVRQSSLSNAIEALTTGAKSPPDTAAVFALAEEFFDWVYMPEDNPKGEDKPLEDIPF